MTGIGHGHTKERERNQGPKANKTKKKKGELYCYFFYKASVKSALKDNWNNCKNSSFQFALVKKSVLIQRYLAPTVEES